MLDFLQTLGFIASVFLFINASAAFQRAARVRRADGHRCECARSHVRGLGAEPGVGGGLHVHRHPRGLALRRGNVWDNAVMESFFSTLKTERCRFRRYGTRDEARQDIFDYIERFHDSVRRHSTLGHVSPMQFEQAAFT